MQKFELSNGLRLLIREDPRLPLVSMVAVFRGGLLAETRATNGLTRLMAKVMVKGTATRTAEQIADTIEAVGGNIGSDAGNNSFSISLDVTRPDTPGDLDHQVDVARTFTLLARKSGRSGKRGAAGSHS